ncbi:B12-binding domain-containing radical SAM protein [Candidatus Aerophobetes bacterium]|uniref:B12-binding domain-containing radical SAM protein n=1 Tax=Aerophobetes bacterium TaxID=2030807 RepID=A0A662DJW6_UNCAE|nr:MAG: B12-binding domain-containing radical SAM protein [Candidatus Aerophobetes bacterium]
MKIELIAPTWTEKVQTKRAKREKVFKIPPLGLLNVAAVTPRDIKVTLTDENIEPIDFEKDVDLVGITTVTSAAPRAYEIARQFRKRGVPVVLGGPHVSVLPEEALQHASAVVVGEAEGAWEKLLEDFVKGGEKGLKKIYKNEKLPDLSKVPFPRWDILKRDRYIADKVLHLTRGCPYNCSFCSVTQLFGRKIRCRPIDKVVDFIKENIGKGLKGRLFVFLDDNIMGNKRYAKELFRSLIPLKIIWMSQSSINAAYDKELLDLAARSGCKALFIGLESVSEGALKEVGKRQNKVEFYEEAIKRFHRYGIFIHGAFIFGMDAHDRSIFKITVDFVNKVKLDSVQYSILTPLPGTRFYKEMEKEGRIIDRDWSNYDCGHVVFRPKKMSPAELDKGFAWSYVNSLSFYSIFKRMSGVFSGGRWKYGLPLFIFNLLYRKTCSRMKERIANPMVSEREDAQVLAAFGK